MIEAHLVEVCHAQQLTFGLRGVNQRTQEIEDGGELQRLADGTDELHGLGEELGMQIDDACLVERAVQTVDIVGELDAVVLDDIRGTTDARRGIVAVLGDLIARAGNHKTTGRRDIKRVLAVATRAYHVNVAVGIQDGGYPRLQDTVAEAQQLVDRDTTHLQGGQQGGNLFRGVFALRDTHQDILHFLTSQFLVVQHPVQDVFHCLCHIAFCIKTFPCFARGGSANTKNCFFSLAKAPRAPKITFSLLRGLREHQKLFFLSREGSASTKIYFFSLAEPPRVIRTSSFAAFSFRRASVRSRGGTGCRARSLSCASVP